MSKIIGNTVGTTLNPQKIKMSQLEQDLKSLKVGGYTISAAGISSNSITFRTDMATNIYSKNSVTIKGTNRTVVQNLVYPENDTDAASKEYVDDAIAEIDLGGSAPTKMSQLEQDLQSLVFGNTTINGNYITKAESGGRFDLNSYYLNLYGNAVTIEGSGGVSIKNLNQPTNDKDAANKEYVDEVYDYVDDITGNISSALDSIIALQTSYIGGDSE